MFSNEKFLLTFEDLKILSVESHAADSSDSFRDCLINCAANKDLLTIAWHTEWFLLRYRNDDWDVDTFHELSTITSIWICSTKKIILIGLANGFIVVYSFDGNQLLREQLHDDAVQNIFVRRDILSIHYASGVFLIQFSKLVIGLSNDENKPKLIDCCQKKLLIPLETFVTNSVHIGINNQIYFDYLKTKSMSGSSSMNAVSSSSPPVHYLCICVGRDNFLNFLYHFNTFTPVQLSDVAKVVSRKLFDALSFPVSKPNEPAIKTVELEVQSSFTDNGRHVQTLKLSPCTKYVLLMDNFNQILLVECPKQLIVRKWTEYSTANADCQISFYFYFDQKIHRHYQFVVVLDARDGHLDLWPLVYGSPFRIANSSLRNATLVLGESYEMFVLTMSGYLYEISVPFDIVLEIEMQRPLLDQDKVCKGLKSYLKRNNANDIADQLVRVIERLDSDDAVQQLLDLVIANDTLDLDFLAELCERLETRNLAFCQNVGNAIALYQCLVHARKSATATESLTSNRSLNNLLNETDYENLRKLYSISRIKATGKPNVHFNESRDIDCVTFKEFLQVVHLKTKSVPANWTRNLNVLKFLIETFEQTLKKNATEFLADILRTTLIANHNEFMLLLIDYWLATPFDRNIDFDTILLRLFERIETVAESIGDTKTLRTVWRECRKRFETARRPFKAYAASVLCRQVAKNFNGDGRDDDFKWEQLSEDFCLWSLLIGKLEDVSLLEVITKSEFCLRDIIDGGKDTISTIIVRWLLQLDLPHVELVRTIEQLDVPERPDEPNTTKMLRLLKLQFPFSLNRNVTFAYLSWSRVQKLMTDHDFTAFDNVLDLLNRIETDVPLKIGMHEMIWSRCLQKIFERVCRLVNTVGKIPKEKLCRQDVNMSDVHVRSFIKVSLAFLTSFVEAIYELRSKQHERETDDRTTRPVYINYLWDDEFSRKETLIDTAHQKTGKINYQIVSIHHELCVTLNLIETFNVKSTKFLANLFDSNVSNCFFIDFVNSEGDINFCYNSRLKKNQTEFLTTIIRESVDLLVVGSTEFSKEYEDVQRKINGLRAEWDLDLDELKRNEIVHLFYNDHDALATKLLSQINNSNALAIELLKLLGYRLRTYINQEMCSSSSSSPRYFPLFDITILNYANKFQLRQKPVTFESVKHLAAIVLRHATDKSSQEYKLALMVTEACNKMTNE